MAIGYHRNHYGLRRPYTRKGKNPKLRDDLKVVHGGVGGGYRSISDDEIFFNCPWYETDDCPLDPMRGCCGDKPCRMMRLVER